MNPLLCARCHKHVSTPDELLQHASEKHAVGQSKFPCNDCRLTGFTTEQALIRHRQNCWGPSWDTDWYKVQGDKSPLRNGKPQITDKKRSSVPTERPPPKASEAVASSARKGEKLKVLHSPISSTSPKTLSQPARRNSSGLRTRPTNVDSLHDAANQAASLGGKKAVNQKKLNSTVSPPLKSSSVTPNPSRRRSRSKLSPSEVPPPPPPSKSPPPKLLLRRSENLSYTVEDVSDGTSTVGRPRSTSSRSTLPQSDKKIRKLSPPAHPPASSSVQSKRNSVVLSSSPVSKSSKKPGMKEARTSTASQKSNGSLLQLRRRSSPDAGSAAPPKPVKPRVSQGVSTPRLEPEGDGNGTHGAIDTTADASNGVRDPPATHPECHRVEGVKPPVGDDSPIRKRLDSTEGHSQVVDQEVFAATNNLSRDGKLATLRRRTSSKTTVPALRKRPSGKPTPSANETPAMSPVVSGTPVSKVTAPADLSADSVTGGVNESPRDLTRLSDAPETAVSMNSHVDTTKSIELPPSQKSHCPTDSLLEPATSTQPVLNTSFSCSETAPLPVSPQEPTSLPEVEPAVQFTKLTPEEGNPAVPNGSVTPHLESKVSVGMPSVQDVPSDCSCPEKSSLATEPSLNGVDSGANLNSNACTENSSSGCGLPKLLIDEDHVAVSSVSEVHKRTPSHSAKPHQLPTFTEVGDLVSPLVSTQSPHSTPDAIVALPGESSGGYAVIRADSTELRDPDFKVATSPVLDQPNTGTASPIFGTSVVDEKSVSPGKDESALPEDESRSQSPRTDCPQTHQIDPVRVHTTTLEQEAPGAMDAHQKKITDATAPTVLTVTCIPQPESKSCGDVVKTSLAETACLSNGEPKALEYHKNHTGGTKAVKVKTAVERHATPLKKLTALKNGLVASPAKTISAPSQPTNCSQSTTQKKAVEAGRETDSKASAVSSTGEVTLIDWDSFIALPVRKPHTSGGPPPPCKQVSKPTTPKPERQHRNQSEDVNGRPSEASTTVPPSATTTNDRRRPASASGDSGHSATSTPRHRPRKRLKLAHVEAGRLSDRVEESLQSPSLAKGSTNSAKVCASSWSSRADSLAGDEGGSVSQADSSVATVPGDQKIPSSTLDDETASSSPLSSDSEQNPKEGKPRPFLRSSALLNGAARALFGSSRATTPDTASTLPETQPSNEAEKIKEEEEEEENAAEKRLPPKCPTPDKSESSGLDTPAKPSVSTVIKNQSRFLIDRKSINATASSSVKHCQDSDEALRCQACGLLTSRRCALQMHVKRRHPELYVPRGAVARAALKLTATTTTTAGSRPPRSRRSQKRKPASLSQVIWRCPGCYPFTQSFPSALELLSHLPHCRRNAGSRTSGGHHGSVGVKWSPWPEPLSLPGTGFGCCICGLLFASASRLDRHRRASHDSRRKARIGVTEVGSDAFIL
ncbi:hypothetical protein SprV_0401407300 [Sparganum proliferum]